MALVYSVGSMTGKDDKAYEKWVVNLLAAK